MVTVVSQNRSGPMPEAGDAVRLCWRAEDMTIIRDAGGAP
jgi:hypothetical protein